MSAMCSSVAVSAASSALRGKSLRVRPSEAVISMPLPLISDVGDLQTARPQDRGFLLAGLKRGQNRLVAALDQASAIVERHLG